MWRGVWEAAAEPRRTIQVWPKDLSAPLRQLEVRKTELGGGGLLLAAKVTRRPRQ
jgi:hypothetical protein